MPVGLARLAAWRRRGGSPLWDAIGLIALCSVACVVFASPSAAAVSCTPTAGGACISIAGQQAAGAYTVSPGGNIGITINWNASCPLAPGEDPGFHYWYVDVELTHADNATQGSGPLYAQTGSVSDSGSQGFSVGIDPPGARTDTIQWDVMVHCGAAPQTIGSGSISLTECDPDAFYRALHELNAAKVLFAAGTKSLIEFDQEHVQSVEDYRHDAVDIAPEKYDALQISPGDQHARGASRRPLQPCCTA